MTSDRLRTGANAGSGVGGGNLHAEIGQRQRDKYLAHLLNELRNRCGHHVLLALHKAAQRAHEAYQQNGRSNRHKARLGGGVA